MTGAYARIPRRGVVTGVGVVSPIGCGADAYAGALEKGQCGIRRLPDKDPELYHSDLGAPATDFRPQEHFSPPELRRMDRASQMVLVAFREAKAMAGLNRPPGDNTASLVLGTTLGGMNSGLDFYRRHLKGMTRARQLLDFAPYAANDHVMADGGLHGTSLVLSTACAAGTPVIDKFYTYTNNDWSLRCAIYELDECVEYRLPNINVDDDIFADPLPQNAEEDYVLLGKQLRRKTVINPGQYFAVSNIEVTQDQDVLVREDFSDCTDIGTVNPFSVPGGVQVVLIDASGDVYDIGGELANGNGGWIELYPTFADVYVENVPAGSTLRVMVKFQPLDELDMIGRSCTNYEILLDEEISASAVLTVEPK